MSAPELVSPLQATQTPTILAANAQAINVAAIGNPRLENCIRIRDLGFRPSAHVKLYGEDFRIVSDPFPEGSGVAVRAVGATDPTERTLRLPVATLVGLKDMFPKRKRAA